MVVNSLNKSMENGQKMVEPGKNLVPETGFVRRAMALNFDEIQLNFARLGQENLNDYWT